MIRENELASMHISPSCMTENDEYNVVRAALLMIGKAGCRAETILYPGKKELLLFIRIGECVTYFFAFDGFEELLAGAAMCGDMPSTLSELEGRFVLELRPMSASELPPVGEFGERLDKPAEYALYIAEHGRTLIESNAVLKLVRVFFARQKR